MRDARIAAALLGILAVLGAPGSAAALPGQTGGVGAPGASRSGGSEAGIPAGSAHAARPVVGRLSVPSSIAPGAPPEVIFQIDEPGAGRVQVVVAINSLATRRPVLVESLGWVLADRAVAVRWPSRARLDAGSYHVSVSAHDRHGASLLRSSRRSGVAVLTVAAPASTPPAGEASTEPGVPRPAQTVADGAVFPVAGPHSFGGPENRFGAPRAGYVHQGQDVLTAEGTPVLAPLAGTIYWTSYQAAGAGYYAVERTAIGFDLMFAHCQAGSLDVREGQVLAAGTELCRAGQTGDATAPHLHMEMWVGGWQAATGHPIDPLPYLQAWEAGAV